MILRTVSGVLTVRIFLAIMVQPVENMVYTLPYTPDSDGSCRNKTAEYYNPDVNLCCSKCTSGTRRKVVCSSTSDTVCEPCPSGQYSGTFNYFPKCFRCPKCSADKGLKYVQKCSSTTKTQCACQTGMYCVLDQHPDCKECASYTYCKPGHGVSVEGTTAGQEAGTAESDVECASCPNGTFSDQHSYTQICQHHTDCVSQGRDVLTYGTATTDAVCGPKVNGRLVSILQTTTPPSPPTTMPPSGKVHTTSSLQSMDMSTVPTTLGSKLTSSPSDPLVIAPMEDKSPGVDLWIVAGAIGGVMFLLLIIGTIIYKKEDINGNSEKEAIKCLLGKGDCSNVGQAETKQDAIKTWSGSGCSNSLEGLSICPVQSTLPQPSILASIPQPSPQSTSPLASVPLVNVNITVTYPVNIGNELCSRPTSTQIDSPQADPETPLSREEEVYVNMPQRESCKEALTAVQEFGNDV
ncbi:tumor necrosis factor receptor superfamily member 1B isoform X2 [Oncorhynchus tshawytscha]|uniref:tumor necrosis factor receptor superfamily member 1B isoform X2 n=1 Tax=Oncorhynchus tshawytscha TaxID=74940 RepID=UPI000D0A7482|nr:tumor necrosis factor receptor superfamily member 1B isoform X2 [Oncorhynchus tshawytscha]